MVIPEIFNGNTLEESSTSITTAILTQQYWTAADANDVMTMSGTMFTYSVV